MAEQQDQDKTEDATPSKLEDSKRRGQVAKSIEINSFVLLSAAAVVVYWSGESMALGVIQLARNVFRYTGQSDLRSVEVVSLFKNIVISLGAIFWPFMAIIITAGILGNVLQTGPIFSTYPLKPDFHRLNPVEGFKRLFSSRMAFESVKTIVKLILFSAVLYFITVRISQHLMGLLDTDPMAYPRILLDQIHVIAFRVLAVLLVVAFLDFMFTRWDFSKRMRMSRRELKDEIKRREGDPQIRAKLRELQREAARRAQSVRRVPEADVLVTNPTRLAIALKYERGKMNAPHVIAKGAGELAKKMRDLAGEHGVPIVENKALARNLFRKVDLDQPIGDDLFPPIARILAWIYSMRHTRPSASRG